MGFFAGACLLGSGCVSLRPDLVLVEHVEFRGAERAAPGELRHLSDVRNGVTMWAVDMDRAERGVQTHPWVESAVAYREWPASVVIEVQERSPVALVELEGDLYYVDNRARPFVRAVSGDLDYPVITGIDTGLARIHPDIPRLVLSEALWLLTEAESRGIFDVADVSEIWCSPSLGYDVHLLGGSTVAFGLGGLSGQMERLAQLVAADVDLESPHWVDLAPATVAIVRPLSPAGSAG